MTKPKKFNKKWKKKRRKRKRKFIIEIRTNRGWTPVELIKDMGRYLLVKLPCGEIIKRKKFNKIRWGKTKLILKRV